MPPRRPQHSQGHRRNPRTNWLTKWFPSLRRVQETQAAPTSPPRSSKEPVQDLPSPPSLRRKSEAYYRTIRKNDSKTVAQEKLLHSFQRNQVCMTVRQNLLIPESTTTTAPDWNQGRLRLPPSRTSTGTSSGTRPSTSVSNGCVICMEAYRAGEKVVWSCNPQCPHAYHQECMTKYLLRIQKKVGGTPCCICRFQFTDLKVEQHAPKSNRSPRRQRREPQSRRGMRHANPQEPSRRLWWPWRRTSSTTAATATEQTEGIIILE